MHQGALRIGLIQSRVHCSKPFQERCSAQAALQGRSAPGTASMTVLDSFSNSQQVQAISVEAVSIGDEQIQIVPAGSAPGSNSSFDAQRFFNSLTTQKLGQSLLCTALLSSTQTLLHQHFTKLPDGSFCVADQQTSGKGRGGNTWTSPKGCLMFSLYKEISISGERLPYVQYVVSLAIIQAIQDIGGFYTDPAYKDVRIKWPNDIYYKALKIGGILCQSIYRDGKFHLIIGAGLNVSNSQPTTCLADIYGADTLNPDPAERIGQSREELLSRIANHLERYLEVLRTQGFQPLKDLYLDSWLHSGQKVVLEEKEKGETVRIQLTIEGISTSGYMVARNEHGEKFELHPDGNSLDFFAGLVRRKTR